MIMLDKRVNNGLTCPKCGRNLEFIFHSTIDNQDHYTCWNESCELGEGTKEDFLKYNLNLVGFDVNRLPKDVKEAALTNGYSIINNHFMAYTDNTKSWYIDKWF